MFDENSIDDAEDIRRDPALGPAMPREAPVDDHEVPLGHDHAGLIFQRRWNALDQPEETIAAGLDMSAVLDVVGRPVALSRHVVSLVEESIEGLEDKCFVLHLLGPTHILLQVPGCGSVGRWFPLLRRAVQMRYQGASYGGSWKSSRRSSSRRLSTNMPIAVKRCGSLLRHRPRWSLPASLSGASDTASISP